MTQPRLCVQQTDSAIRLDALIKRRDQLVKIIVRWHIECHREMDNAYSELELGTVPIRYLF